MFRLVFWLSLILLVALLASLYAGRKSLGEIIAQVTPGTWLLLLLILLLAATLRFGWLPFQHNVFYDEFLHIDVGQRAGALGQIVQSHYDAIEAPHLRLPKWGPGSYLLQAVWYRLIPPTEESALLFTRFVGVLSVAAAFFLGTVLFADCRTGLWCALLLSVYPLHLKFCTGYSIEVVSILAQIVATTLTVFSLKSAGRGLFPAALLAATYLCLIRVDNAILGLPLMVAATMAAVKRADSKRGRYLKCTGFVLVLVPVILQALYAINQEAGYHGTHPPIVLLNNSAFWFTGELHPWLLTVMAVLGLGLMRAGGRLVRTGLAAVFLLYMIFYSLFHRVGFAEGDFARFALLFAMIPMTGAAVAFSRLSAGKPLLVGALALLVGTASWPAMEAIVRPYQPSLERETRFVRGMRGKLPAEVLLFSEMPIFNRVVQGTETFHSTLLADPGQARLLVEKGRPLYLYRSLVSLADPNRSGDLLRRISAGWTLTPVVEESIDVSDLPHMPPIAAALHGRDKPVEDPRPKHMVVGFYELSRRL